MSTDKEKKIKKLLDNHKPETVILASWLEKLGISHDLQKRYKKSDWIRSIGVGAYKRPNDLMSWEGALYSMQFQACLPIHAGALTALAKQGLSHYFRADSAKIYLITSTKKNLPSWFKNYNWLQPVEYIKTSMLQSEVGFINFEEKNFSIQISAAERAILECLYLAPDKIDLIECYQILEGLVNLRPKILQELLENCSSIKVKRLFLYMSKKIGHQWFDFIDHSKINLGEGDRSIVKNGKYVSEYKLVIPKELADL
jgi:hypothetical protein